MAFNYLVPCCYVTFEGSDIPAKIADHFDISFEEARYQFTKAYFDGAVMLEQKSEKFPYGKWLVKNYDGTEYRVLGMEMTNYK